MTHTILPDYEELPEFGELGVKHSRGLLPCKEGTLSFTKPLDVVYAAGLVQEGIAVPLNLAVDAFDPPLFARSPLEHQVIEPSRNEAEDIFNGFNPQSSSQLDGLAHVRAREYGYYDGSTDLGAARANLGMHNWAARGIAARGVLLDLTELYPDVDKGHGFSASDLLQVAAAQGVSVMPGDVLLVRTGWAPRYLELQRSGTVSNVQWNGIDASAQTAAFLWDKKIAAVGSDNPAVENAPGDPKAGSLHRRLLPGLGMPLFELLDLERLAQECRARQRWEFLFVSVPMFAVGAVSSPSNAIALL